MKVTLHRILATALALTALTPALAGNPYDMRSRLSTKRAAAPRKSMCTKGTETIYAPMIIELKNAQGADSLVGEGAVIFYTRGNMALACVPREKIEESHRWSFVNRASLAQTSTPAIDRSRALTNVDAVHRGDALPQGYDGTNVIAGFCDIGFDPAHIAFRDRVSMMSVYVDSLARRTVYAPETSLHHDGALPAPDTHHETHATHVANIMTGSYTGNNYYGAAPGATIAATTSCLSDVGLLAGIEDIIAFAKETGRPAVVNLSMGSYLGPHDGTDLVNRYLDLLGDEAIIVFSAGNNGNGQFSLSHTFAADNTDICGSMLESLRTWSGYDIYGSLDIWSADSRPFDLQLVAWDQTERRFIYQSPWIHPQDCDDLSGTFEIVNGMDDNWDAHFPGSGMWASYGIDPGNGRFTVALDFDVNPFEDLPGPHHWARYVVGWRVRGNTGVSFDAYADGQLSYMRHYGVPGQRDGDPHLSISNLSCNHNTITIGSWNSRNTIPALGGGFHTFDYAENIATSWSSHGTLRDGRHLPHICAPGNYIVSAMNSSFLTEHPDVHPLCYSENVDGTTYYWYGECGTSMAAPMAAGTFALWLQADPTLGRDDILEIAQRTARRDFDDIDNERWGAGALDALAGLKEVIDRAGAANVDNPFLITVTDRRVTVTEGSVAIPFTIHDMQGRRIESDATLAPGIYIVTTVASVHKINVN